MARAHPWVEEGWSSSGAWESEEGPAPHHSRRTTRREEPRWSMATEPTPEVTPSSVILMSVLLIPSFTFSLIHALPFLSFPSFPIFSYFLL